MVEQASLAVKDNGVGKEAFISEVGSGLELLDEETDALEVIKLSELGDGKGEGDAVEVGVGGEGGGPANVEDTFRVLFGFKEGEGGA